jgi:hypothetical protein
VRRSLAGEAEHRGQGHDQDSFHAHCRSDHCHLLTSEVD